MYIKIILNFVVVLLCSLFTGFGGIGLVVQSLIS